MDKKRVGGGKRSTTPVVQIDKITGVVKGKYPSIFAASEATGIHSSHISQVLRRTNRDSSKHGLRAVGGYYWISQAYYDFLQSIKEA